MLSIILATLAAAQAAPPPPVADPVICKSSKIAEVGTRMKRAKRCMLKSQWKYEEGVTRRELQEITAKGTDKGLALGR